MHSDEKFHFEDKIFFYAGSKEIASIELKTKGLALSEFYAVIDNWAVYFSETLYDCTSYSIVRCDND